MFGVAVEDLNGDGKPDIVVADDKSSAVSVLLNTTTLGSTTASFAAQQTFASNKYASYVTLGDVNGDGKPDVIVSGGNPSALSVLVNTTLPGATTVSFAAQQTLAAPGALTNSVLADLNVDGRPDLIVASDEGGNAFSTLINTPDVIGTFNGIGTITEASPPPTAAFTVNSQLLASNATTFSLTISQSAVSGMNTTLPFTLSGTAVNGTDYDNVTASPVQILEGQTSVTITGTLLKTVSALAGKSIVVTLGSPTDATLGSITSESVTFAPFTINGSTLIVNGTTGNERSRSPPAFRRSPSR